jgi:hypothetical protein
MFDIALEDALLANKLMALRVLALDFAFSFDPCLVEGRIDSAKAWLELALVEQQEENNMPLYRGQHKLGSKGDGLPI